MKAAIYARVSTDDQETEQQVKACKSYCEAKGWELGTIVMERRSAWKGARPEWEKLKQDLRARKWNALVIFRIDRAWRRSSEFVLDFQEFTDRGIVMASVMEGIDASTPMGRAMLNVVVALAELERTNIAEATRHRLQALKNLGKKLGRPMKNNCTDEEIFTKFQELGGIRKTATALNVSVGKVHKVVHNPPPPENGDNRVGGA